jgi:hypothetical protein
MELPFVEVVDELLVGDRLLHCGLLDSLVPLHVRVALVMVASGPPGRPVRFGNVGPLAFRCPCDAVARHVAELCKNRKNFKIPKQVKDALGVHFRPLTF